MDQGTSLCQPPHHQAVLTAGEGVYESVVCANCDASYASVVARRRFAACGCRNSYRANLALWLWLCNLPRARDSRWRGVLVRVC